MRKVKQQRNRLGRHRSEGSLVVVTGRNPPDLNTDKTETDMPSLRKKTLNFQHGKTLKVIDHRQCNKPMLTQKQYLRVLCCSVFTAYNRKPVWTYRYTNISAMLKPNQNRTQEEFLCPQLHKHTTVELSLFQQMSTSNYNLRLLVSVNNVSPQILYNSVQFICIAINLNILPDKNSQIHLYPINIYILRKFIANN